MKTEIARKIDHRLGQFLASDHLEPSEQIPVVIRLGADDELDQTIQFVEVHDGTIRHRLPLINAFSAWVALGFVRQLADEPAVASVEFVDWTEIAGPCA